MSDELDDLQQPIDAVAQGPAMRRDMMSGDEGHDNGVAVDTGDEVTPASDGDEQRDPAPNGFSLVGIGFGAGSALLWLTIFLGAVPQGPIAAVGVGVLGLIFGLAGLLLTRREGHGDMVISVIGVLCPLVGLVTSVTVSFAVVSAGQAVAEANSAMQAAVDEISAVTSAYGGTRQSVGSSVSPGN